MSDKSSNGGKLFYLNSELKPYKKHEWDAGYDLISNCHSEIPKFHTVKINTGVRAEIKHGFFGLILPRSSFRSKGILIDGIIDSDYRGEIMIVATNISNRKVVIESGIRVAQLIIIPVVHMDFSLGIPVDNTKRGRRGFGSTGI